MIDTKNTPPDHLKSTRLRIWRGTSREEGGHQEFEITFEDGETVLDGLTALRRDSVPGSAGSRVDGAPVGRHGERG